jgi:hypothetical protein
VTKAQTAFMFTAWLFIVLAALLFLVPTSFSSTEAAAWTCLGTGLMSHLALMVAIIYDQVSVPTTNKTPEV